MKNRNLMQIIKISCNGEKLQRKKSYKIFTLYLKKKYPI